MKYKELPSEKLVQKLLATSFESPSANRKVYNWSESVIKHIRFLEGERIKLVQKYGKEDKNGGMTVTKENMDKFQKEFKELLEMEIDVPVYVCPIKEDWFDDEKCSYPKEKELWITPKEIKELVK